MKRRLIKWIFFTLIAIPTILLAIIAINYALCPIYRFPEPKPFSGSSWYNPYQELNHKWYKANFHAHAWRWFGLTNGADRIEEIRNFYRTMGYDIAGISDYQYISTFKDTPSRMQIPGYEHGFNPKKTHQLALGARKVVWLDYPFGQNSHHKQHVINTLKDHSDLVVLAHPSLLNGYTHEDMSRIAGYDGFEALNHYRYSLGLWDTALSSGRAVWVFGGDDCHNISWANETGVRWTMVHAKSKSRRHIIRALRDGSHYAVAGKDGVMTNRLKRLQIKGNRLEIECESSARKIRFIGQGGILKQEMENMAMASIPLDRSDTYVRVEVLDISTDFYLNPVVRWNGKRIPRPVVQINWIATWAQRLVIVILLGGLIVLFIIRKRKSKTS